MSEAPLKATLKAGTGYNDPWVTVDADTPAQLTERLKALSEYGVPQAVVEAASLLQAANNAAPLLTQEAPAPAAPAPQDPWASQSAAPAQQQQQQIPSGRQENRYGGPTHPEGLACEYNGCGKVLEFKKTAKSGAWRCPDWRWNNGNPNGHRQEWA